MSSLKSTDVAIKMTIILFILFASNVGDVICLKGKEKHRQSYDFIVVGGGSAGSVVASRLSEDPSVSVLLLEAGGIDPVFNFISKLPLATPVMQDSKYDWQYVTESQTNACLAFKEQRMKFPRGKTLGGTSTINQMIYARGNAEDYNHWASLGNKGWSYEEVLQYFKKSEDSRDPKIAADAKYHSTGGYLSVETISTVSISGLRDAFLNAGKELGYPIGDYNGKYQTKTSPYQVTTRNGERWNTAKAFLEPILSRSNLNIITDSLVMKILFDISRKAYGVSYDKHGTKYEVKATKEIILSCGAIGSPQLLLLSGVGSSDQLDHHMIPVVAHVPGVGENLQDHVSNSAMIWTLKKRASIDIKKLDKIVIIMQFILLGPPTMIFPLEATAFLKTEFADEDKNWPDIQITMLPLDILLNFATQFRELIHLNDEFYKAYFEPLIGRNSFTIMMGLMRPKSRGCIRLQSSNPYDSPLIDPKYLSNEDDLKVIVSGMKKLIQFVNSSSFKKFGPRLHSKRLTNCAAEPLTDAYFECLARSLSATFWHPVGTCKMGVLDTDSMAVVDSDLRVRGVNGLRVIDASIMPTIPSGNTNAPTVMVAEKGSDLIKSTWRLK